MMLAMNAYSIAVAALVQRKRSADRVARIRTTIRAKDYATIKSPHGHRAARQQKE
jgi:hypothetical protein